MEAKPLILVVDDEEAARYGIGRCLTSLGYEVREAASGLAALSVIDHEHPDVVVSDINMPGMDGLTLLRTLRQTPAPPLVILVTAHGSEQIEQAALDAGAFAYIQKPFDACDLRQAVRTAVRQRRPAS